MGCDSNMIEVITYAKKNSHIDAIWFDENINNSENKSYIEKIKPHLNSFSAYDNLEEGFSNFYSKTFNLIFTIVSGKLWGRFLQLFMENINKIINIPYVIIFTSQRFKDILLQNKIDDEHILSYDTLNKIDDPFYNPGGVITSYEEIIQNWLRI